MSEGLLAIAEEVAEIDERKRDAEPEAEQDHHRAEGNRAGALLTPYEEIQEEARLKDDAGIKRRRLQSSTIGDLSEVYAETPPPACTRV